MNILYATSEAAPFIKTGGLADVAGSLPPVLAAAGHDVRVVLPLYERIGDEWRSQMNFLGVMWVHLAWRDQYCGVFELKRNGVTFYFLDNEYYFRRWDIYGHFDDAERFAFFSRAVIQLPASLDWPVDILQCNDWQTALIPIYLLEQRYYIPQLANTKSVFTIHNIEYQGRYNKFVLGDVFGLDDSYFNSRMLACYDDVNLMQGAIFAADALTTVSPTYAEQLQDPYYGYGLDGVIRENSWKFQGILNGIDTAVYDPAAGRGLAAPFSADDLSGKAVCKEELQRSLGLTVDPNIPVIACVSRLVSHKGFDLVTSALDGILSMGVQLVVLGTGDPRFEEAFRSAMWDHPAQVSAQIMYSAPLADAIYGGADMFLMPSVSEPCGLSQMIAMRYGTVPIVRETGGLRDTVTPYNRFTGEGRGFTFANASVDDLIWVLQEAVDLYYNNKEAWHGLQIAGMTADFSWNASAQKYIDLYEWLVPDRAQRESGEEPEPEDGPEPDPEPDLPTAPDPEAPPVPDPDAPPPPEPVAPPVPGPDAPPPPDPVVPPEPGPDAPPPPPEPEAPPAPGHGAPPPPPEPVAPPVPGPDAPPPPEPVVPPEPGPDAPPPPPEPVVPPEPGPDAPPPTPDPEAPPVPGPDAPPPPPEPVVPPEPGPDAPPPPPGPEAPPEPGHDAPPPPPEPEAPPAPKPPKPRKPAGEKPAPKKAGGKTPAPKKANAAQADAPAAKKPAKKAPAKKPAPKKEEK